MSPMSIYIVLIQQLEKHFYKQLSMFPVPATLAQNQKSLLISFIWFVWDGRSASFRGIYNSRLVCHSSFFLFFFSIRRFKCVLQTFPGAQLPGVLWYQYRTPWLQSLTSSTCCVLTSVFITFRPVIVPRMKQKQTQKWTPFFSLPPCRWSAPKEGM